MRQVLARWTATGLGLADSLDWLAPLLMWIYFGYFWAETGWGKIQLGALAGTLYTSNPFDTLIGPPIAGFIIDQAGGYRWAVAFAFATASAALVVLLSLTRYVPCRSAPEGR